MRSSTQNVFTTINLSNLVFFLISLNCVVILSMLDHCFPWFYFSPHLLNTRMCVYTFLIVLSGLVARQRKAELQRLNEQLRQINAALRRQAKIESYAPSLSYAPVGARIAESEVINDPRKEELIYHLKNGKNFLRNQAPEKAFVEFKTALELAQNVNDPIEEKKAARGLGM